MKRSARILDKALDILSKGALLLSGILLLAMGFNVTYGVITRYVFDNPSIIAIEMTKILMIPALVLAVSYVQRYGRHLKVDFLSGRFPQKLQLFISEIAVPIGGLFVGYVLVWKGWDSAVYSYQVNERSMSVWSEVLYPVRFTIPVGYGLLCLMMIGQLCRGIGTFIMGNREEETENPGAISGD
jgi:TRAP-type mannitol/chloroaromatic compound transport system permease small subunit